MVRNLKVVVLLAALFPCIGRAEGGFGGADFSTDGALGHLVLRSAVEQSSQSNFIAVGRVWTGSQYKGLIASYLTSNGNQDVNFGLNPGSGRTWNGEVGRLLFDFGNSGYDNLCNNVVSLGSASYIAACRSMNSTGYYDVYLVKFNGSGVLDGTFGSSTGIYETNLGGSSSHAFVRGMVYNSNSGVVTIVGATGTYSGGWTPYIASFNATTGAIGSSLSLVTGSGSSISGTAVAVTYDSSGQEYYVASTDTSGSRNFYVHQLSNTLVASGAPWGNALSFSSAGGGTDSVPTSIAFSGTDVYVAGSNHVNSSSTPWRCMVAAVSTSTGSLDTSFGQNSLSGSTSTNQNQGATLFTEDYGGIAINDCELNSIVVEPAGTNLWLSGTAYNGTNYDYLTAKLNSSGTILTSSVRARGPADDVVYTGLFFDGSASNYYAIGRSLNSSLYNGGGLISVPVSTNSNTWSATNSSGTGAPGTRYSHTAVWTGTRMLIWGGYSSSVVNTGSQYDPLSNSWTAMTTTNAPLARDQHTAVWTGSKMIVWGGVGAAYLNDGGIYDPVGDSWTATASTGAPSLRADHTAVWTGSVMIVWGGKSGPSSYYSDGYKLDPTTNSSWTAISSNGAPIARAYHTAVWTGSKMIIWGGNESGTAASDGGLYDPSGDSWSATASTGAPIGRYQHTAVWTGTKMIVWGGTGSGATNTGGVYDASANSWTATASTGAPVARSQHTAVWTGSKMIIWGGFNGTAGLNSGGIYDPSGAGSWTATSTTSAPAIRYNHTAVWTGNSMVVFGGQSSGALADGGIFTVDISYTTKSSDVWTATTTTSAPAARSLHAAVWTGSKMIIWGGNAMGKRSAAVTNTGGTYDPVANSWTTMTTSSAPAARDFHTAIWTGSKMVVWGGLNSSGTCLQDGGQYDPVGNSWSTTTTTSAPSARDLHTAIWTGTKMIVWGGINGSIYYRDGGIYDPSGDSWISTSTVGAPSARDHHTAVWTGSKMIIWGGSDSTQTYQDGGNYDPSGNSWSATTTAGAPSPRSQHTATWTGSKMIIWGGSNNDTTGGVYDPSGDSWIATSTTNAPSARESHSAVWAGSLMIIWGGVNGGSNYLQGGGRYDPAIDSWTVTSTTSAPAARQNHTAVWTGSRMILWGGDISSSYFGDGGIYSP